MTRLALDLALALPDAPNERDACVERLSDLLRARGLDNVHVEPEPPPPRLCLHYDPERFGVAQIRRLVQAGGAEVSERYRHETHRIDGMDCATCAGVIEHALQRRDGVIEATVSYGAERLRVEYDTKITSRRAILETLEALGYHVVEEGHDHRWFVQHRELLLSVLSGLLLLAGWLITTWVDAPWVALGLLIGAFVTGGFFTTRDAWQSLRQGRFAIDTLMLVAAAGAASLGEWFEGALLLFLFSLGHALEHMAMERARSAIEALGSLAPRTALVRRDGAEREVPVEELERGDIVVVRPGQRIPADGEVDGGASAVDQAAITGESMPVEKVEGDPVFAGTVNGEGALDVKVTRLARESTLSRMVKMVAEAGTERSPTQRFTERFERVFVPIVLIVAGLLIVVPPLLLEATWSASFYRAMAVLVAASPCALAIATSAAVLAGIGRAARGGVLIKGGIHLENLGRVRAIALDKTGTLTHGAPEVTDVVALEGTEQGLLATAASVERLSGHPLAAAVVRAAEARSIEPGTAENLMSISGQGVRATLDGEQVEIGNVPMFEGSAKLPAEVRAQADELRSMGRTFMIVRRAGRFIGLLGLADTLREQSPATVAALRALGVREIIMLTGDHEQVARLVAAEVGIDDVRADLMPAGKVAAMKELTERHQFTAMIGDGVNDAPAMARATVGIAMGGAGTDVALETADVALMGDDLARLPFAVGLSRAARRIIQQNLWLSLGMVALLVPATLLGVAGIGAAVMFHEGSTLVVVANALRLLAFREN